MFYVSNIIFYDERICFSIIVKDIIKLFGREIIRVEIYDDEDFELLYKGWSDDIDSDLLNAEIRQLCAPLSGSPEAVLAFIIYTY